jgi:hypothetical protein
MRKSLRWIACLAGIAMAGVASGAGRAKGVISALPDDPNASDVIVTSWEKSPPKPVALDAACGPDGSGGANLDIGTNQRKNRTDVPASYHFVRFSAISNLAMPSPSPRPPRSRWDPNTTAKVAQYEGVAVSVVGYLLGVKVEDQKSSPNGESTNCHRTDDNNVDWHVWLANKALTTKDQSVVVEVTPRVRKNHPRWSAAAVATLATNHTPVRVSGWLMYDPDHPDELPDGAHPSRATLWEVHPVMKFEKFANGQWVDLDQGP